MTRDTHTSIRCIKLVNSAISWTDPIKLEKGIVGDRADEYYNKAHGYVNKRAGLVNNTYAIMYELAKLIDLIYIDSATRVKTPAADIILINNNSRFNYNTKQSQLKQITFDDADELKYDIKTKHILKIYTDENNTLRLKEISLDEFREMEII